MSKLIAFTFVSALVACSSAFAAPSDDLARQSLVQKSQYISRFLRTSVGTLDERTVLLLGRRLDNVMAALPGAQPPVAPTPELPPCEIQPAGLVGNTYYAMRVQSGGTVLAGVNTLDELVAKLVLLGNGGVCSARAVVLELDPAGLVGNTYYSYRLNIGNSVYFGVNTLDEVIQLAGKLVAADLVSLEPSQTRGQIVSAGLVGNTYYSNRVSLSDRVFFGANSLEDAVAILGKLRAAHLCI